MSDLRFAMRMLAKNPGFTLLAAVLLAVGKGANAVIFSAVDVLLWRPLPVRHADELVRKVQRIPRIGTSSNFHYSFYEALRARSTTLSAVFGEAPIDVALNQPTPAEQVRVHMVTPGFFEALGVPALSGRTLSEDDAPANSATPPAVLSYGFWRRRFNGDPAAVGRTIVLHGHPFVIVGVMPRAFNGTSVDTAPDVRVPLWLALDRIAGGRGFQPSRAETASETPLLKATATARRLEPHTKKRHARLRVEPFRLRVFRGFVVAFSG